MPRKSIYDAAALLVVAALAAMMVGVFAQMATYVPGAAPETDASDEEQPAAGEARDLLAMSREERDALRDRDGVVWGIHIDWSERYPAKEEGAAAEETAFDRVAAWFETQSERVRPYEERVAELEDYIEDYSTDYAPGYQELVEAANAYDALLGWELVDMQSYNPVIMAEENYFITCVARQDRTERAAEIAALDAYCASLGMGHIYVTTPNDACRYDEDISGVMDFYNQNADRLQKALREAGVDTLDLRDKLHEDGMDHHASFYETDHHWRPETGRWAAGWIARQLNESYGFAIDETVFEPDRWRAEVYEKRLLGSQGKKVTLARAKPEDFTLFYPNFDTRFHIAIPSLDVDKVGDFSVFYRYNAFRTGDLYKESPYAAWFYGDQALTRVHNELRNDGRRVLVLGHSFDNCLLPFLALGVEYLDSIDLREFNGSLETFLEQNHYDVVIEIYTE